MRSEGQRESDNVEDRRAWDRRGSEGEGLNLQEVRMRIQPGAAPGGWGLGNRQSHL